MRYKKTILIIAAIVSAIPLVLCLGLLYLYHHPSKFIGVIESALHARTGLPVTIEKLEWSKQPLRLQTNLTLDDAPVAALLKGRWDNMPDGVIRGRVHKITLAENKNRKQLYREVAKSLNIDPSQVDRVARVFAKEWQATQKN